MQCPICASTLKTRRVKNQGIEIDQCPGCQGIWFDANELNKVLGQFASSHERIPKGARKRKDALCPRCDQALLEHNYPGTGVKVHSCASCAGIWLDDAELNAIRKSRKDNQNQLIKCPNCQHEQIGGDECQECGIIFSQFRAKPVAVEADSNYDQPVGDNPVENLLIAIADASSVKDRTLISRIVGSPEDERDRLNKWRLNRNIFLGFVLLIAVHIPLGYVDSPNFFRPCEHYAPGREARCMVYKDGAPWEIYPGYYTFYLSVVGVISLPFAWQMFYYRRSRWRGLR